MPKSCLTLILDPQIEEKLLDLLLEVAGDELFVSTPAFSHGTTHGRLSEEEKVMGRSHAVRVQILVTEERQEQLLQLLRERFAGTGLRYWATPLSIDGEIA
ncbi:TPA: DUF3240 family protein [Pseudomonas aeruginosa]|jgi:hypothetical protein|uniref:Uncharacterized protein n=3 Tax=Pseudomonadota TaxID=1224 RepID=A0A142JL93_9BURK|nr:MULTISPECIES: DUF3240 family protein [Pseudomonadota]MBI2749635.1 DUF3240 family protein [Burkholderiales bacterium]MBX3655439.1 DUF3240 family protein [Ramlibacter sp.]OZB65515.1 MAG: hypothetical protein B7X31_01535 [Thiomonas sp. 13-66-29]QKS30219.1 MAG: DUF3240 family protein [Candidatus Accumulibacter similis]HNO41209.1 DUF3240 family protein [Ottowia sp.]HQR76537.1 DUF3240 family protein [Burkholderiaceae bacterium]|tara:strand:+ start:89150 stop:89452 length:303 start_codon:yes stop_codon:yes gene_type:complete